MAIENPTAERDFRTNNFGSLRLFAASQVVVGHCCTRLHIHIPFLDFVLQFFQGVPIFFVISGFLVSSSLEHSTSLASYFSKRGRRIYPALWMCITCTIIVALIFGFNFLSFAAAMWLFLQFFGVIYTPSFLSHFGIGSYNGSLWTIPIELQFYIVLPIIGWIMKRGGKDWIKPLYVALALVAALLLFIAPGDTHQTPIMKVVRYSFIPHVYLFALGILLQVTNAWKSKYIYGKALYWIAAYFFMRLITMQIEYLEVISRSFLGIAAISAAYTYIREKPLKDFDISYGVYLYHGLFINILFQLGMTGQPFLIILVLFLAYISGTISWIALERRFLRAH